MARSIAKLVFVGFHSRVAALDVDSGDRVWDWKAPSSWSSGYVTLSLLGVDRLIAAVDGYMYCLDPATGAVMWSNEMSGFGTGVTSIAAFGASSPHATVAAAAAEAAAQAAGGAAT